MHSSASQNAVSGHGHPHSISLNLRDLNQLFNSMDPSPFLEKDLDDDAEDFIVGWARSFRPTSRSSCVYTLSTGRRKIPRR